MEKVSREVIQEILDNVEILDIVGSVVPLKRAGSSHSGLCPFHSEKSPSFHVSPSKKMFKCFGCGVGGDAIAFLMKYESKSFPQVLRELGDRVGITVFDESSTGEYTSLIELHKVAQEFFLANLKSNPKIHEYLKKRGLSLKTIHQYGLGYAPDSWDDLLGVSKRKLPKVEESYFESCGLFTKSDKGKVYNRFRDRVMFPIRDLKSRVVGFGGRILTNDKSSAKYLNSPETSLFQKGKLLYNLDRVIDQGFEEVLVVEGYMDVIGLFEFGIKNAVAPLGTGYTNEQVALLEGKFKKVTLIFDGDNAGDKATSRAIEKLVDSSLIVMAVRLKNGLDPLEYLQEYGVDLFQKEIDEALSASRFYCEEVIKNNPLNDRRNKKIAYVQIRDFFRGRNQVFLLGDDTMNEPEVVHFLSAQFGVDEGILREQFFQPAERKIDYQATKKRAYPKQQDLGMKLMLWAYETKELMDLFFENLKEEDFEESIQKELFINLRLFFTKEECSLEQLVHQSSDELAKYLNDYQWECDHQENINRGMDKKSYKMRLKEYMTGKFQIELSDVLNEISKASIEDENYNSLVQKRNSLMARRNNILRNL
ncbi:MAG: DNA primase [Candidatus Cloacimonadota bacterium]|nr:MAG: DNA primase [Candidatus Cloacimonadota bacterium]